MFPANIPPLGGSRVVVEVDKDGYASILSGKVVGYSIDSRGVMKVWFHHDLDKRGDTLVYPAELCRDHDEAYETAVRKIGEILAKKESGR